MSRFAMVSLVFCLLALPWSLQCAEGGSSARDSASADTLASAPTGAVAATSPNAPKAPTAATDGRPSGASTTTAQPQPPAAGNPSGLTPQQLSLPDSNRNLGEPTAVDEKLRAAAARVLTDPGNLPQLEVNVDGQRRVLPLEHTHVRAELSGFVARVEVVQRYKNPLTKPIEAIYVFPLPENSAVDDMKIRIGERLIEAEIQRREQARKTYEDAKRQGYTAALLEQERPNIFTQSIANMEPGVDIEIILRYVQDLTYDAGEYEFVFPMVVGPRFIPGNPVAGSSGSGWARDTDQVADAARITPPIMGGGMRSGHDIDIEVDIAPGLTVADLAVPTHEVQLAQVDGWMHVELAQKNELPNRDFVLRFRADQPLPQGTLYAHRDKRGGFFSLVVQPPTRDVDALLGRREIVFVIDVSGSMSGVPLAMAKDAARVAIRTVRPVDTFNVITFAGQTARAFAAARPAGDANVRLALEFVDQAMAGGGTYLANAVQEALSTEVADGRNRYVFFLTDGYVGNENEILALVQSFVKGLEAKNQKARTFGFGVGSSVNRFLLDGIGKAGHGATVYLTNREDPAKAVRSAFRLIDQPILSDVRVDWAGLDVTDVEPDVLPDLLASRPLVLHGRFKTPGQATVTVSGNAEGKRMSVSIPVQLPEQEKRNGALETLWARSRIETLGRQLWDGDKAEVIETITGLGLDYRIVTAYTSFVAVDRSKKVGDGNPLQVVQPVEAPEGVNPNMAAPAGAIVSQSAFAGSANVGGIGMSGKGMGGGGLGTRGRMMEMKVAALKSAPAEVGHLRPVKIADPAEGDEKKRELSQAASITPGQPQVTGALDVEAIRKVIRANLARFKHCYEQRLKIKPELTGKAVLRFTIEKDGKVSKVEISGLGDDPLVQCLRSAISQLRFPANPSGPVIISYPMVFASR